MKNDEKLFLYGYSLPSRQNMQLYLPLSKIVLWRTVLLQRIVTKHFEKLRTLKKKINALWNLFFFKMRDFFKVRCHSALWKITQIDFLYLKMRYQRTLIKRDLTTMHWLCTVKRQIVLSFVGAKKSKRYLHKYSIFFINLHIIRYTSDHISLCTRKINELYNE